MAQLITLQELLKHEIDDLYSAEEQIIDALPKMVEKASNPQLKKALNDHLEVTRVHKARLDRARALFDKATGSESSKPGMIEKLFGGTKCKGTEGLIREGEKLMGEAMEESVRDAAIIASAQKIEHYEISGYGTARAYAMQLGFSDIENLLTETLDEEYAADDGLTALALFDVNVEAQEQKKR